MRFVARSVLVVFALACLLIVACPGNAQVTGLTFRPVDAAYSLVMDRVILISANPDQLHIYDPVALTDQIVSLPGAPLNLSLSPDGTHAAVAFTNAVVYVDLHTASISNTFSNVAVGTAKVVCGTGYIYVFPSYVGNIVSINIASGQATTRQSFNYVSGGTFDPAVNAVYSAENGLSPNSFSRFDASSGVIGSDTSEPSAYFDLFRVCGPLWLSRDGSVIYSACGAVYRASTDSTQDMRYLGVLPIADNIQALSTSDSLNQIATISAVPARYVQPPAPNADTVVTLYASHSLDPVGQFATTPFQVNSTSFPAHARWVFYNSSSSAMFIVTQADSSAGLLQDYAIENVNLTNTNSCNVAFGNASASAISAGGYATTPIISGEDCVFTAVSNAPWITLTSGYYGSGNTTLTYLVRPNLSSSSRTGTISIGTETFTVNQEGADAASALTPLSFKPIAAAYDGALDKIIMVSASPNELHMYDPISQADQIVPLAYLPLSLAVSPDGLSAAVGHSGAVSIVNLQSLTVSQTLPVDMDNGGIELAGNGYVYTFPSQTNSWGQISSIQLSTGKLTSLQDTYYGNFPALDASGNYLYVGGFAGGSSKLDISNGPAKLAAQFLSTLYGGNIWLTQDGNRLIDSSGHVFFTSTVPAQDLQPNGQLSGTNKIAWAADSQIQHQIAALSDPSSGSGQNTQFQNAQLQIYAANGLQLQSQTTLPGFSNAGSTYISHGKYLFWNADASKLFAITEADPTSGLLSDYAVYTVDAPQSLPGCSYTVSPASLNVAPSSSNSVIHVTSNCGWIATRPSANWLSPVSSGVTTGNGQFTVNVQSNPGVARSGTITVGNQTVTVNQAPVTCIYTLSMNSASFSQFGGTGQVNLSTGAGCPWSIQSNSPWLTVTSSQSGSGPGTIQFSVASNTASYADRYGSLIVGGVSFGVSQTAQTPPQLSRLSVSSRMSSLNSGGTVAFDFEQVLTLTPGVQIITLANLTTQMIPTGQLTITGPNVPSFPISSNCGASIAPGASCTINVQFSAMQVGNNTATLNIPVAADGTKVSVILSGLGILNTPVEIVSMPTGKVLEVPEGSTANGTLIAQNALNASQQQQWLLASAGNGFYLIRNSLTGKVLDVTGGSMDSGTSVQQWDYLGGANQQWKLESLDGIHYAIINRQSGKVLDVTGGSTANGTLIQQWDYLDNPQQKWVIEPTQSYTIADIMNSNGNVLDMPGSSTINGTVLDQQVPNGGRQQQWQFIPIDAQYFMIMNRNSGKVLDVTGGSMDNGAFVQQWNYLGGANQQWKLVLMDGSYEIINRQSGYVLDDTGFSIVAGTPIQQWTYLGGRNQRWYINAVVYFNIVNEKSGLVLDVIDGSMQNGAKVQQWVSNGFPQQQWQLVPTIHGTYLVMNSKSGKVLDVDSGSTKNGIVLQQWDNLGGTNQEWQLFSFGSDCELRNVNSQKVLDITGGSNGNGALLQQWDDLSGTNQRWRLVPASY